MPPRAAGEQGRDRLGRHPDGLEAPKALALGADAVAVARPFLVAASEGEDALVAAIERFKDEMRVALFCAGAQDAAALRARGVERVGGEHDRAHERR